MLLRGPVFGLWVSEAGARSGGARERDGGGSRPGGSGGPGARLGAGTGVVLDPARRCAYRGAPSPRPSPRGRGRRTPSPRPSPRGRGSKGTPAPDSVSLSASAVRQAPGGPGGDVRPPGGARSRRFLGAGT